VDSQISPDDLLGLTLVPWIAESDDMAETRSAAPDEEALVLPQGLTREEDDELRRLHWFSQIGILASRRVERLIELRLRDRRNQVRPPREFAEEAVEAPADPACNLAEVRRQIESMAQSRLHVRFTEDERQTYRALLELERTLLGVQPPADRAEDR
jgi:hypothetical protein